jgi:Pyridoxal-phosphate dependent enzyme
MFHQIGSSCRSQPPTMHRHLSLLISITRTTTSHSRRVTTTSFVAVNHARFITINHGRRRPITSHMHSTASVIEKIPVHTRRISQDLFLRWFASDTEDAVMIEDVPSDHDTIFTTATTIADNYDAVTQNDELDNTDENNLGGGVYLTGSTSTLIQPSTNSHSQSTLDNLPITFADISRAEVAIRGGVRRTTCEKSHFISELCDTEVYFKNEFRQFTGSFKERGARNAILKLIRDKQSSNFGTNTTPLRGVIAASAGNHALAIAYHGQQLGIPVTVVMPTTAPLAKVDKCRVRASVLFVVAECYALIEEARNLHSIFIVREVFYSSILFSIIVTPILYRNLALALYHMDVISVKPRYMPMP